LLLATASVAIAQQRDIPRIGAVSAGAGRSAPHWQAFDSRLAELGYVDGKNIIIEFRNAEGQVDRFPSLMADLVNAKVDLIFAPGPEAELRAAKNLTSTIPIVVVAIDYDPVAAGLVNSLARPGGNVTGVFVQQIELTSKRLALLKEAIPGLKDVAVFWDSFSVDQRIESAAAGKSVGLHIKPFELRNPPYSFDEVAQKAKLEGAGAVMSLASPVFFRQRSSLADSTLRNRLPSIAPFRESAEAGALMSYGASLPDAHRRAADYIGRILKGTRPAELPMEQPNQLELVLNLATARLLGVTFPQPLKLRADVIVP
jgi:putative ABC transport system substrate-binding protein